MTTLSANRGGWTDPHFRAVREAFEQNFSHRGEVGAAVCVSVDGTVVADLWGGPMDVATGRAWQRDTLVNVFSIGKGLAAIVVARLVGIGVIDLDEPVSARWPAFAAAGKETITVRQLMSHQAGLPAVRERLAPEAMLDHDTMAEALARQRPWWEPGAAHGYHTNTFGFLVGELVRRATGRTLGAVLRDDVARPLGADVWIGLPASEDDRVATFPWPGDPPPEVEPAGFDEDALMRFNTYWNPSGLSGAGILNTRAWRAAEIPSTNGHATARGVARVYAAAAAGGTLDGVAVMDPGALWACTTEQVDGHDVILERPSRFAVGFQLPRPERPLGPNAEAFGHFGAGGSLGFCDPLAGVAFGYVMNEMGPRWQNPRNRALVDAVYASL